MNGLVTYSVYGELFLFDVAGQDKKLVGPTKAANGEQYVKAMNGLVTYGSKFELFLFNVAGQGKKLDGPTKAINCVQYVEAKTVSSSLSSPQARGERLSSPRQVLMASSSYSTAQARVKSWMCRPRIATA